MEEVFAAAVILSGVGLGNVWLWLAGIVMFVLLFAITLITIERHRRHALSIQLTRAKENPLLNPNSGNGWESEAVFNPAAYYDGSLVHLIYRALGQDGVSRFGYAWSNDGIHFERLPYPVFTPDAAMTTPAAKFRNPFTSPARLEYDRVLYASGGGWGGSEDPRMVSIQGRLHITFNIFNGWYSMRVGLLSIDEHDFKNRRWKWTFNHLSAPGRHKNWVLFPEKIDGRYAIFHNLFHEDPNQVQVAYADTIEVPDHLPPFQSPDPHLLPNRQVAWHNRTRSAGPPPIKTPSGWLLLYQAMQPKEHHRYKVGAMLLDLNDPTKVLYRSTRPILEPDAPYENDWKPGIIYASGAIVKDGTLFVYYGGGDKTVNVATANLDTFIEQLTHGEHAVLTNAV